MRPSSLGALRAILAKDLRVELRTLQSVPAMALFATTTFVLFRFGLDRESLSGSLAAGVLLATVLFAAIIAINRLFVAEREVPVFALFFLDSASGIVPLAAVLLLADLGLAATGVLISQVAANSRARDLLVPLILLPLLVPVMIAAAGAARELLAAGGPSYDGVAKWLAVLAFYDMTFAAVGFAVYDFLLED
jgi:heme exporter protein B